MVEIILTSITWLLALSTINDIAILIWLGYVTVKIWQEWRATRDKLAYAIALGFLALSLGRVWMIVIAAVFVAVIQTYTIEISRELGLLTIGVLGVRTVVQVIVIIAIIYLQMQWLVSSYGNNSRPPKSKINQ